MQLVQADGLKPYTIETKIKKLAELNAMSKTSGIAKFSAKLYQTGFKLNRVPATTFQVKSVETKDIALVGRLFYFTIATSLQ